MALNYETRYPGQFAVANVNYPFGEAQNIIIPGDGVGSPWEKDLLNDRLGFEAALLERAGITPNDLPDTAQLCQKLTAMWSLSGRVAVDITDLESEAGFLNGEKAFLTDPLRGGPFYWGAVDLSVEVTADTQQGVYVAPTSDPTGASGAWVRIHNPGEIEVRWFGATGDGTTFDTAAIQAADDFVDGGLLKWHKGVFRIASPGLNKNPRNNWQGVGDMDLRFVDPDWYGTVIEGNFEGDFVTISSATNSRMSGSMKDMVVTAPVGNSLTTARGIYVENVRVQTFERIYIHLLGAYSFYAQGGGPTAICNKLTFNNVNFAPPNAGMGCYMNNVYDSEFNNFSEFAGTTYGLYLEDCNFMELVSVRCQISGTANLYVKGCGQVRIDGVNDLGTGDGIVIQDSSDVSVKGRFRSNEGVTVKLVANNGETCTRVTISDINVEVGTAANTDGIEFVQAGTGSFNQIIITDSDLSQCTNKLVNASVMGSECIVKNLGGVPELALKPVGSFTTTIVDEETLIVPGLLVADMTVTLANLPARSGSIKRVVRKGGGAFNLLVDDATSGTLKTLTAANQWATFAQQLNGTWHLVEYGTL